MEWLCQLQHEVGAIHEEAPVKIGSEISAGFPNHPFGITRHHGAPLIKIRLLPFIGTASHCAMAPIGMKPKPTRNLNVEQILISLSKNSVRTEPRSSRRSLGLHKLQVEVMVRRTGRPTFHLLLPRAGLFPPSSVGGHPLLA